jgi:hypothetical protein
MSLSKYLIVGAGLAACNSSNSYHNSNLVSAGVYILSKDESDKKFDPKVHTLPALLDILEEIYLEYASAYLFYHQRIDTFKE